MAQNFNFFQEFKMQGGKLFSCSLGPSQPYFTFFFYSNTRQWSLDCSRENHRSQCLWFVAIPNSPQHKVISSKPQAWVCYPQETNFSGNFICYLGQPSRLGMGITFTFKRIVGLVMHLQFLTNIIVLFIYHCSEFVFFQEFKRSGG